MAKTNAAAAYRDLKSPNIKTRKRALKIIKAAKKNKTR
ncbi:putative metal homeostasis protein [Aerococcaceae bacterium WGS1372]